MDFVSLRDRLRELDLKTWDVIRQAADAGDPEAQYLLGTRIFFSMGDNRECAGWLKAAARQGHPEANFYLVITWFDKEWRVYTREGGRISEKRRRRLLRAAELGSPSAQHRLAQYFASGRSGFEKDWAKARGLYLQAAAGGNGRAQARAGWMMVLGEGGPVERDEGFALMEAVVNEASTFEAENAADLLAALYSGNYGLPADPEKSAYWATQKARLREKWNAERAFGRLTVQLHTAAEDNEPERALESLLAGVPVDHIDVGWTPLMDAASRANVEVCRVLLDHGADVEKAMKVAASSRVPRTPEVLRLFMEYKCPIQPLLFETVGSGRVRDAAVVIEAGADVNEPNEVGYPPLLLATLNSPAMIRLLLKSGADPRQFDQKAIHGVQYCASFGHVGRLLALLEADIPIEVLDSALVVACRAGYYRCADALVRAGARLNPAGVTPLMTASDHGSLALVNLLLESGADPGLRDDDGKSALDYALPYAGVDLLEKAIAGIDGAVRHRWTINPTTSESVLKVRHGDRVQRWTNGHAAIIERLPKQHDR